MQKLFAGLLFVLLTTFASAQEGTVKGKVSDTLGKKDLSNAVVSLLQKKDSTLIDFQRTNKLGRFQFNHVPVGPYVLLVTYPKFADFSDQVEVKEGMNDLKQIPLTLASHLLDAVIIRTNNSIRIKGDTTEFVADSFKVREGATVEELLRMLPGFQVNGKGEITAQGQRVGKVLVDGEEFFGDDPTIATRNLGAKAVDKVQVYDTKTENQQLTGLTTGNEGKTVNIKLKEDSKKGSFGKATFGSDYSKYVDAKAMFNKFKASKKISVYGSKSDVSTGGLNWDDRRKLGMEEEMIFEDGDGMMIMIGGGNDDFNNWSLRGLPHAYAAGGLYSNKWNEGKNGLNTSYNYNRLETTNASSNYTQNILPTQLSYRNKLQETNGLNEQHAINGKYEWKVDSLASLKFTTVAKRKVTNGVSSTYSEFLNENKQFINESNQVQNSEAEKLQNENAIVYKQLFKKKNRQLTTTVGYKYTDDDIIGTVRTNTNFYKNNSIDSTDIADQQKTTKASSGILTGKVTYSEPLSLKLNMVIDYSYTQSKAHSYRNTFNPDASGKYQDLDELYSSNFDLDAFTHSGMSVLRLTDKKWRGAAGIGLSTVKMNLNILDSNKMRNYKFLNFTPQANINYTLKPQNSIGFSYRGTTRQPSIDQLQPLRENTDRLYVTIGNPNLKVGFNHNFNLFYNFFKTLSQKYFYMNIGYNIPVNAIATITILDITRGKQVSMPVNVNGNRNYNFYSSYSKQGAPGKLGYNIRFNGSGGNNINFVNGQKNITDYLNTDLYFNLNLNSEKLGYLSFGPQVGYNATRQSLQTDVNNNYWNYGGSVYANLKLPGKIEFNTDLNISLRQQLKGFSTNPNYSIWNASITKEVFKNGKIGLIANDILNQNVGFSRNINSNFISEDRYQKINRYFLLSFEWSFNTMPGK